MSAKIIAYNLAMDVTDRTAQSVVNTNPNVFQATIFAPASSYVPKYLYTSLGTLFMGSPIASSIFATKINPDLGTGGSDARGSITVITKSLTESVKVRGGGMNNDRTGAVEAELGILITAPRVTTDPNYISNIAYRINYILDNSIRQLRMMPGDVPIPMDPGSPFFDNTVSTYNSYYKCIFEDFSIPVKAQEQMITFCASYVRTITI